MRSVFATLVFCAALTVSPTAFAAQADTVEEEAAAAAELAAEMRAALRPDICLTTDDALAAINRVTANADLQTIAAAIDLIEDDQVWCDTARAAIQTADQAVQLTMAANGATGGVGGGGAGVPFSSGGVGAPGGGGGSNYP
jgi:hypothetical protein